MDPRLAPLLAGGLPLLAMLLASRRLRPGAAFPLAFAAGFLALERPGSLPPSESWRWLLPLAGACIPFAWTETRAAAWPVRLLLLGGLIWAALDILPGAWIAGAVAAGAVGFALHDRAAKLGGWEPGALLALAQAAGAGILFLSGSQRFALLGGALTGASLGWAWTARKSPAGTGAAPAAVLLPLLLWTNGAYFAEVPLGAGLLLWILPAATWIPGRRLRWASLVLGAGAACLWAGLSSPPLDY